MENLRLRTLRIKIQDYINIEKDKSKPEDTRVNAGIEKVKSMDRFKKLRNGKIK